MRLSPVQLLARHINRHRSLNRQYTLGRYSKPRFLPDSTIPDPSQHTVEPLTREESIDQLKSIAGESDDVLATADTIFPFDLFPDTITVSRNKVTISKRVFFRLAETVSVRIEDIMSATNTVGPFFGGIVILSRVKNQDREIHIGPLWRHDAIRIKRIIHGFVIAKQRAVDTSSLHGEELAALLLQVGDDNH